MISLGKRYWMNAAKVLNFLETRIFELPMYLFSAFLFPPWLSKAPPANERMPGFCPRIVSLAKRY